MAEFEIFGDEDDSLSGSLSMECPECGKSIELPLELDIDTITCPHCHATFEFEK